jgi:multisubunit Na+/H+ antiporter MnhG subunit
MIKEELKLIKESKRDLKKFGLTVGTVLLLIAVVLYLYDKSSFQFFGLIGIVLIMFGVIIPASLKPLNRAWMMLAIILGWVMTRVILAILFYFVLTPISFLARIFGKKFLELNIDKTAESYWEKREMKDEDPANYERQF